ncbi:DUF1800 domain-containing protein [Silvimonas iriomotensis]|uniref:DUF1800 domain-containing protein n=1 Tax=Silvimonas iriomotensis TaxID=449662 RepID=A0ABQ2P8K6_9NEIS|nr:DUF1800 domain-containing protein [Silvimonas iriomotensis]GGP21028.1 hypothetical protein GCM10010970_18150 [Silvimonas iriomotensis]
MTRRQAALHAVLPAWLAVSCLWGLPGVSQAAPATEAQALYVLNRVAYGPAPGDVARVMASGVDRYIDDQLHPERTPLPAALQQQLAGLQTTRLSQDALIRQFRQAAQAAKKDPDTGKQDRQDLYRQITEEAGQARLLQAVNSPNQLQEALVEFWFNHFNVFQGKGLDRALMASYEREAIRPFVLGRFRDLLGATAHHPAMLFYLDNWLSVAPGYQPPRRGAGAGQQAKASGLNENYARELMELHTLGVDGGYTQTDVTELARMLTGWTINPRQGSDDSAFYFDLRRHDTGTKQWLGHAVSNQGQREGEMALDELARAPATAHHISAQLAQYFVADNPPPALVERMAQTFTRTDGDLREVMRTLLTSPEFLSGSNAGTRFKTPYRYVISSLRASAVPLTNPRPVLRTLAQMGMPLYGWQTPDGYKVTDAAWLNQDALAKRATFATALASGKLPLAKAPDDMDDASAVAQGRGGYAPLEADALYATLGSSISGKTRTAIAQSPARLQAALVLGSPDFMKY